MGGQVHIGFKIAAVLTLLWIATIAQECNKPRSLSFLIDSTNGTTEADFGVQVRFISDLLNNFIGDSLHLGVQVYSSSCDLQRTLKVTEGFTQVVTSELQRQALSQLAYVASDQLHDDACAIALVHRLQEPSSLSSLQKFSIVLAKYESVKGRISVKERDTFVEGRLYYVALLYATNADGSETELQVYAREESDVSGMIPLIMREICPDALPTEEPSSVSSQLTLTRSGTDASSISLTLPDVTVMFVTETVLSASSVTQKPRFSDTEESTASTIQALFPAASTSVSSAPSSVASTIITLLVVSSIPSLAYGTLTYPSMHLEMGKTSAPMATPITLSSRLASLESLAEPVRPSDSSTASFSSSSASHFAQDRVTVMHSLSVADASMRESSLQSFPTDSRIRDSSLQSFPATDAVQMESSLPMVSSFRFFSTESLSETLNLEGVEHTSSSAISSFSALQTQPSMKLGLSLSPTSSSQQSQLWLTSEVWPKPSTVDDFFETSKPDDNMLDGTTEAIVYSATGLMSDPTPFFPILDSTGSSLVGLGMTTELPTMTTPRSGTTRSLFGSTGSLASDSESVEVTHVAESLASSFSPYSDFRIVPDLSRALSPTSVSETRYASKATVARDSTDMHLANESVIEVLVKMPSTSIKVDDVGVRDVSFVEASETFAFSARTTLFPNEHSDSLSGSVHERTPVFPDMETQEFVTSKSFDGQAGHSIGSGWTFGIRSTTNYDSVVQTEVSPEISDLFVIHASNAYFSPFSVAFLSDTYEIQSFPGSYSDSIFVSSMNSWTVASSLSENVLPVTEVPTESSFLPISSAASSLDTPFTPMSTNSENVPVTEVPTESSFLPFHSPTSSLDTPFTPIFTNLENVPATEVSTESSFLPFPSAASSLDTPYLPMSSSSPFWTTSPDVFSYARSIVDATHLSVTPSDGAYSRFASVMEATPQSASVYTDFHQYHSQTDRAPSAAITSYSADIPFSSSSPVEAERTHTDLRSVPTSEWIEAERSSSVSVSSIAPVAPPWKDLREKIDKFIDQPFGRENLVDEEWVKSFSLNCSNLLWELKLTAPELMGHATHSVRDDGLKLIEYAEMVFLQVAESLDVGTSFSFANEWLSMTVRAVDTHSFNGFTFQKSDMASMAVWLELPKALFSETLTAKAFLLAMAYHALPVMDDMRDGFEPSGHVVTVSVSPQLPTSLPSNLSYTMRVPSSNYSNYKCVYWNKTNRISSSGSWSTDGCFLSRMNSSYVTCECNHMTTFAALTQVRHFQISKKSAFALEVISYIGCGASIAACLALLLIYGVCGKLIAIDRHIIHMNLAAAIAAANVLFLMAGSLHKYKNVCLGVSIGMLYFYMAAFFWMLVEGIHVYLMIVKVFRSPRKMKVYMVIGWLLPAVVVAIAAAKFHDNFIRDDFCWIPINRGLIWTFVGPAIFVLLVNACILTLTLRASYKMRIEESEFEKLRKVAMLTLILMPIFGLTWLFGVLAVNKHLLVFQYVFTIVNAFQGVFIFIFYCLLNGDVRRECGRIRAKSLYSSNISSGDSDNTGTSVTRSFPLARRMRRSLSVEDTADDVTLTKFRPTYAGHPLYTKYSNLDDPYDGSVAPSNGEFHDVKSRSEKRWSVELLQLQGNQEDEIDDTEERDSDSIVLSAQLPKSKGSSFFDVPVKSDSVSLLSGPDAAPVIRTFRKQDASKDCDVYAMPYRV